MQAWAEVWGTHKVGGSEEGGAATVPEDVRVIAWGIGVERPTMMLYGAAQGLKSLINARFAKAMRTLRAMFPEVAFHLFQPSGTLLRMLSGSPMKFWYREEVEQLAFEETMRDIRTYRALSMARDFARHDVRFEDPDGASRARASMLEDVPHVA